MTFRQWGSNNPSWFCDRNMFQKKRHLPEVSQCHNWNLALSVSKYWRPPLKKKTPLSSVKAGALNIQSCILLLPRYDVAKHMACSSYLFRASLPRWKDIWGCWMVTTELCIATITHMSPCWPVDWWMIIITFIYYMDENEEWEWNEQDICASLKLGHLEAGMNINIGHVSCGSKAFIIFIFSMFCNFWNLFNAVAASAMIRDWCLSSDEIMVVFLTLLCTAREFWSLSSGGWGGCGGQIDGRCQDLQRVLTIWLPFSPTHFWRPTRNSSHKWVSHMIVVPH